MDQALSTSSRQALSDMKVLDLTHHIAGPYATKLMADYGADVVKIEKPGVGDPTRRMGPFPGDMPHPEKSGLFLHLNTSKRSVTLDLRSDAGRNTFLGMAREADVVVESFRPGVMASFGLDYPVLERVNPRLVVASISNFGQTGPYRDFKASDLVLAGMGGSQSSGGIAEKPPLKLANSVTQYVAGLYALSGILSAFFVSKWEGIGQHLDIALFELLVNFADGRSPSLMRYQLTGGVEKRHPQGARVAPYPPMGVYPCQDGYVEWIGLGRWRQAATMMGRPDMLTDLRYATPEARMENFDEVNSILLSWMMERTRKQCWDEAVVADYMCAPCNTIEEAFQEPHMRSRGFWAEVEHPALGKSTIPGRPFIMNGSPWQLRRPAPLLGEHNAQVSGGLWQGPRAGESAKEVGRGRKGRAVRYPLEGIRVVDVCPMQAGNSCTAALGDLGAQVIKVESTQYAQYGIRGTTLRPTREHIRKVGAAHGYPNSDPGPHPWNVYGQILNFSRNKLSFTVDLRKPEGVEVLKRLVKVSDILIESNSPPLMSRLGLDYPQLVQANPSLVMIRMPAYGLSGPYRDRPAMAQPTEALSGHVLLRGYPDVDPSSVPSTVTSDGAGGAAAAAAAVMALHFRKRTGKGQLVELALVENFMPLLGEFYMDYIFNKRLHEPTGNRHPRAAPCGCYPCAGEDQWVNITVHDDEEWEGFCRALGNPEWTRDPEMGTEEGRYGKQDEMDEHISSWTRSRDRYDVMYVLQKEGVPSGPVLTSRDVFSDPHLLARGYFEEVVHPEAGSHLHATPPWRLSRTPARIRSAAPMLGEHNAYVYKELLGYSDEECARLEATGHIGTEPAPHIP